MPRCPVCDYSSDTNKQSHYFLSLPEKERSKPRKEYRDSSGERQVGCASCYIKEEDKEDE